MIPYSASFESEVVAAGPEDKAAQAAKAKELGGVSMIDRIIKSGYKNLQLCHYFTAGEDEVRCWTFREGSKAPELTFPACNTRTQLSSSAGSFSAQIRP